MPDESLPRRSKLNCLKKDSLEKSKIKDKYNDAKDMIQDVKDSVQEERFNSSRKNPLDNKKNDKIKTQKCANFRIKAKKLYLDVPQAVWILPKSFEQLKSLDGLLYESDYDLVIKLFRKNGISFSLLDKNKTTYPKLSQHSFEFVTLPLIAFTIDFLKENPGIITTALDTLNSFFQKRLRRDPEKDKYIIHSTVVKEVRNSSFTKYEYEGPYEGYKDFIDLIENDDD